MDRKTKKIDSKVDVWAMGVILFAMVVLVNTVKFLFDRILVVWKFTI